jgi:purine-binding chemotaxis protein CheW
MKGGNMENSQRKGSAKDRYLTFGLLDEEYCIEILKVKEIMGMLDITKVPQTPDFIKGVINLRGQIIPIIDLRTKFELPFKEYSERTCIIVVELLYNDVLTLMGMVVDSIKEVVSITDERVSKVPYLNAKIKSDYITGIAEIKEGVKIVLDIEKVLTEDEFVFMQNIIEEKPKSNKKKEVVLNEK